MFNPGMYNPGMRPPLHQQRPTYSAQDPNYIGTGSEPLAPPPVAAKEP